MKKEVTPARARRRAFGRLLQKVQHAVPGIVLLQHGVTSLRHGEHGWHLALAIAEVVTSVIVFIALIGAIRAMRGHIKAGTLPHPHVGIDWIDIFLGVMLATEAWAKYAENGHIARPTILLAVLMLVLGVWGGKIVQWKGQRRGVVE